MSLLCRVSMSSVFPGREKDWVEFGTFLYEDERTVQTFKNEEGILGKYVKVGFETINKYIKFSTPRVRQCVGSEKIISGSDYEGNSGSGS